ncbi:MAG: hypothetical protein IPP37_20890 [Saprospiraceae bacterium]|nr:hypothetical protein [Saprospiraceae bacterium]
MRISLLFILLFLYNFIGAQNGPLANQSGTRLTPTELSIPASPVFDMMGVTPSRR